LVEQMQTIDPSKQSKLDFHNDVGAAITRFQKANKDIPLGIICGTALQLMFNFPYTWMGQSGTQSHFADLMASEAKLFLTMKELADKEANG